jgi:hypothetical protein
MNQLVKLLIRTLLASAVRQEIGGKLDAAETKLLPQRIVKEYEGLSRSLAPEPTLGARIMTRLAAVTVATHSSLRARGMDHDEARDLTSRINWRIYDRLTSLPWMFTRLLARDRLRRVRRAMDVFMRFPYAPPGYDMTYVDAGDQCVGFDVRRCPAAEFFERAGLSDLCKSAFCDLDYPLAQNWGVVLERSQTISTGATKCDFRFRKTSSGAKRLDTPRRGASPTEET